MSVNATNDKAPEEPQIPQQPRLINVQPAVLSDLQPKYARKIEHDDDNPDAHGWYAGFSKLNQIAHHCPSLTLIQFTVWVNLLVAWELSPAASAAPTHSSRSIKVKSV